MYRALVRSGVIAPKRSGSRQEKWHRWERGTPMELWQMDVVGGFLLADGSAVKAAADALRDMGSELAQLVDHFTLSASPGG